MRFYFEKDLSLLMLSGGKDSTVLIILFLVLKNRNSVVTIHTNHLAQIESFSSLYHCFRFFQQTQTPGIINFLPLFENFDDLQNEKDFREQRYKQIARISEFYECKNLLTGHSKNDKVETIIGNWIRGTNILSLNLVLNTKYLFRADFHSAIYLKNFGIFLNFQNLPCLLFFKKRKAKKLQSYSLKSPFTIDLKTRILSVKQLTRPVLFSSQKGIKKICKEMKAPIFIDRTNKMISIPRNKVREHLLKYICQFVNPNFERQTLGMFNSISNELQILMQYQEISKKAVKTSQTDLVFDRKLIGLFPKTTQIIMFWSFAPQHEFAKMCFLEQLLENSLVSSYILIDKNIICYMSNKCIQLENSNWVTWDSNPELIG